MLDMYVGEKKIVNQGQDRNYLYHINEISDNVWGCPRKFSLMFSLAFQFVRQVYQKNPRHTLLVRRQNSDINAQ